MSNERDQQVTVRRLPDGDDRSAMLRSVTGWSLCVDLPPAASDKANFHAGDLVEVACPKTLYLGQVRMLQGDSMTVGIEHALDRDTVATIRRIWHAPAE